VVEPQLPLRLPQSGNNAAVDAKRRELEATRAAQASRGEKTFYKVTVRVRQAWWTWMVGRQGHLFATAHGCSTLHGPVGGCILLSAHCCPPSLPCAPGQRHGHGPQGHPRHAGPRAERHQVRREADARQVWAGRQDGAHLVRHRGGRVAGHVCMLGTAVSRRPAGFAGPEVVAHPNWHADLRFVFPATARQARSPAWQPTLYDLPHPHAPALAACRSKMSTGLPIEVTSARRGSSSRSYYKLDLDIQR